MLTGWGKVKNMDDISVLVFGYLVQTLLMVYVGLALFEGQLSRPRFAACGVLLAVCLWLVRGIYTLLGIPLSTYTHTLIMTLFFILVFKTIGHQSWGIALGATLVSMTLVVIGSGMSHLLLPAFELTFQQVLGSPWLHILMGYVENVFLVLALLLNKKFDLTLVHLLDV